MRLGLTMAGLLVAGGCTMIGPDFEAPRIDVAKQWLEQDHAGLKRGDYRDWWKLFNDPSLDRLIEAARQQNLDLQIAAVRILEARAQLGVAQGSLFPQTQQVGAAVTYEKTSNNSNPNVPITGISSFGNFLVGFDSLWELDFWGRFRRGIESADAQLAASMSDYDQALVSLTAEVAASYVQIRTFQQRLRLARENETIQAQSVRITEALFRDGLSPELDVQRAKSLLFSTRALIASIEIGLRQSGNALSVLLGKPPGELNELTATAGEIPSVPAEIVIGIPADMLRRRPDVRREELKAAAQSALIGVAKADLLPRFSLRGAIGLNSTTAAADLFSLFDINSLAATIGPSVSWPIFNYGRLKNNVRVHDARFQKLMIDYEKTVLRALREVEDAMIGLLKARDQVDYLQQAVAASRRAVILSLAQYRDGLEDYTTVLSAQRFLVQQQDRLTTSQGDVARYAVALYKALGGGWEIRKGTTIVPEKIKKKMMQRTDWGDLLPP